MCGSGVGGVVFPMLGNYLIEMIGWRTSYAVIGLIIAVIILPWTIFVFRLYPSDMGLKPYGEEKMTLKQTEVLKGMSAKKAIFTLAFIYAFVFGMNSVIITVSVPTLLSVLFGQRDFAQILLDKN